MLKYLNIIQQMSQEDKVRLLCDIELLSDKKFRVMGIPALQISNVEKAGAQELPSVVAMCNSWDPALVERTAHHRFRIMAEQGVDVAIVPGPKLKINPCRSALSEDSLLATAMASAYLRSAGQFGISVILKDFAICEDEIEWLDTQPEERMLRQMLVQPYQQLAEEAACKGIMTEVDPEQDAWTQINTDLRRKMTIKKEQFFLCAKVPAKDTVRHIQNGGLCFRGSSVALEAALERYKQLVDNVTHGISTAEELEREVVQGKAISPESIDEATDRLLRFVFAAKRKPTVSTLPVEPQLPQKVHAAATVLLKNQQALPLKKKGKICIIGDIALEERAEGVTLAGELEQLLREKGYQITGVVPGYHLAKERSDDMANQAMEISAEADVVLLFLGLGKRREQAAPITHKISLPANQQALLECLAKQKGKIIAIAPPEYCPDIVMPEHCAAWLLAPLYTEHSAKSLTEILTGETAPSGKLASSVYCRTDELYTAHRTYKFRDGLKTGGFIGYRYYDIAQCPPPFPFGHGMGLGNFAYSNLRIDRNTVQFTVANRGRLAGAEIAQVYIGKENSAVLRPEKELAAFARIELAPGQQKTVKLPFSLPTVYDAQADAQLQEEGRYQLWVGSSLCQLHLSGAFSAGDAQLTPDGLCSSAYVQSESNILSDHYKLEAKYKTMKKSVLNYVFGGVMLLLAIALKMYCAYTKISTPVLDLFALAISVVGVVFLVLEAARNNRLRSQQRMAIDELSRQEFLNAGAEEIPVYSPEGMFVKEFDDIAAPVQHAKEEGIEGVDANLAAYINKDQDFVSAMDDFARFALERGCKFSHETVQELFASLAASRLIVVRGMNDGNFRAFLQVLSGYFETATYIDKVDASYDKAESVLFTASKEKTKAMMAIEAARNKKHLAHFAALNHVTPENLPLYFTPFVNFARNPLGHNSVTAENENGHHVSYQLPQNLWFVLNLEQDKLPYTLPDYVAEVAVVNQFSFEACDAEAHPVHVPSFTYHQLMLLTERAINKGVVQESQWRKLDSLEKYVGKYTPFAISNKAWLCVETYAYVYQACQGETPAALDQAVCTKLMPLVIAALQNKLSADDPTLEETVETILGEDCSARCKQLIHECNANRG